MDSLCSLPSWVAQLVGYGFAIAVGHWTIAPLMDTLREGIIPQLPLEERGRIGRYPEHSGMLGAIERTLYVASLQLAQGTPDVSQAPWFIGLWLTLKTAAQWKWWEEERRIFNLFLIGNGLSIAYAVVGARLITWLEAGSNCLAEEAVLLSAALVVGTIVLWGWAKRSNEEREAGKAKVTTMSRIPWVFAVLVLVLIVLVAVRSFGQPGTDILDIGTFVVVSLTLIVLIFYAYDTNRLASISQSRWDREGILTAMYSLGVADKPGEAGRTVFAIVNRSTLIIRAKVVCDIKVYGTPVTVRDSYDGTETWVAFPGETNRGWFEIAPLLEQQGKTTQQMMDEYTPENRATQLTMDLAVEFRDELGNKRKLPTRKYYFVFTEEWTWIPVITVSNWWD